MFDSILKPFKKEYLALNKVEIQRSALLSNYHYLASLSSKLFVAPVLKSNAYGHGIVEVAKILDSEEAPFFCLDSLYEAYELFKAHTKTPILIMGYTQPENFKVKQLPFSFAVYDMEMAQVLNSYQWDAKIHIKVDSGMHRLGVPISELAGFLSTIKKLPNLKIEGLMSHLASSATGDPLYQTQVKNFQLAFKIMHQEGFNPKWIHLSASTGFLNPQTRKELAGFCNLVRSGLALYGISPYKTDPHLQPALKLTTKIAQIKKLSVGNQIGYDGTYTVKKDLTLAVLPIGYYDGVDRRLSNTGVVLVDGVECPIIGRVSMNITTVDVSKVPENKRQVSQEVVVFSNNPKDRNSIQNSAQSCQTIPYDLLVHLASTTKRVVV